MTNIINNEADRDHYKEKREKLQEYIKDKPVVYNEEFVSPSGRYRLQIGTIQSSEKRHWDYSIGKVDDMNNNETLFTVHRNYPHFWHTFVKHSNGNEYLLCGEDYQGYTVINLTEREEQVVRNEGADTGSGFCFANVIPSPDGNTLAVDGCYWACPYDIVFYDFTEPDVVPLNKLSMMPGYLEDAEYYWEDNNTFVARMSVDVRKSDGVHYDDLTEEEQEILDKDIDNLIKCETKKIEYSVRK